MTPQDVMEGKFDWNTFLQAYLWNSSVVVSKLHPIMGLRLAALFVDLESIGMARKGSGGTFQLYSGVRTREHQKALYEDICLRQKRCAMVADYRTNRGPDTEGVVRFGSNHQAQDYGPRWDNNEFGHAVDFSNGRQTQGMTGAQLNAAWKPLHDLLPTYGLTYPLDGRNGRPLERWHVEAHPRSTGWIDGPIAWPKRPGVHRPIYRGFYGGDAKILQAQCCDLLGLTLTEPGQSRVPNDVLHDGIIGPVGADLITRTQAALRRPQTGAWVENDQIKFEGTNTPPPPPDPDPDPPGMVLADVAKLNEAETRMTAALAALRGAY